MCLHVQVCQILQSECVAVPLLLICDDFDGSPAANSHQSLVGRVRNGERVDVVVDTGIHIQRHLKDEKITFVIILLVVGDINDVDIDKIYRKFLVTFGNKID